MIAARLLLHASAPGVCARRTRAAPARAVRVRRAVPILLAVIALGAGGCDKKLLTELIPNQPPEVRLTSAPLSPDPLRPEFYVYRLNWVGYDPDGRIDHYLMAVDPPRIPATREEFNRSDPGWFTIFRSESTFVFSAGEPIVPINPRDPRAEDPHTVALFAVDDRGALSMRPAVRSFFSFTQCPIVQIVEPAPTGAFTPNVTPNVLLRWTGTDTDGQTDTRPVRWVYRLFQRKNPDEPSIADYVSFARSQPDSVRRRYAPGFEGWRSVGAETTSIQYQGLTAGSSFLFVVTGFDEAGAYDPVFSEGRNMLHFTVAYASSSGPILRMFNQFFDYAYPSGGYDPSERYWYRLDLPADQPITFNWVATPFLGANIRRYRWVMDLADLSDQTPRSNEGTDWSHWSTWSLNTTSATIGPFRTNNERHLFCIEAEDNGGLKSLGIIAFRIVAPTYERPLLFVDDTRMRPDVRAGSGPDVQPPVGPWPTAAELDTFLFAKGGFPWRSYPQGTLSTPGIFNGYDYDTIGTRGISVDGTLPLSLLGLYRHIVWYTDDVGATYTGSPLHQSTPITALRLSSSPGQPALLSLYVTQGFGTGGGKVWMAGGGAALASLVNWNKAGTTLFTYDSREPDPELRPGRMMVDFAHWREGVEMLPAVNARRFGSATSTVGTLPGQGTNRPGRHWPPNPTPPTPPSPPDYALLPVNLDPKSLATDPPSPLRLADSFWLRGNYTAEYIHRATAIREDYDDDPDIVREFSTLDTLYLARGGTALLNAPVMTYYHGRESQPFVFSGFNFWYWRRTQCIALVDWVLQSVWGLSRDPSASRAPETPAATGRPSR